MQKLRITIRRKGERVVLVKVGKIVTLVLRVLPGGKERDSPVVRRAPGIRHLASVANDRTVRALQEGMKR